MTDSVVRLRMNGFEMTGWSSVSIRKSLDQLADEFTLELTNQRVGESGVPIDTGVTLIEVRTAASEITEGDACTLEIDGLTVITGYVDDRGFEYDAERASLRIGGRSRTGDLVDSSAIYRSGVWTSASLAQICNDLCAPFGISVLSTGTDAQKLFRRFRLEPGETAFDAISRACEVRGILPITNEDGNLDLVRAGTISSGATLQLGKNVLAGGLERSIRGRFSEYIFKGQTFATDEWSGKRASEIEQRVEDPGVGRYRPHVVLAEHQRSREDVGKRAVWERNVRAGRSVRHRYTVAEWYDSNQLDLWALNTLVRIKDEWCQVDDDKLVTSLEFILDDERVTRIELVDKSTFEPFRTTRLPSLEIGNIVVAS